MLGPNIKLLVAKASISEAFLLPAMQLGKEPVCPTHEVLLLESTRWQGDWPLEWLYFFPFLHFNSQSYILNNTNKEWTHKTLGTPPSTPRKAECQLHACSFSVWPWTCHVSSRIVTNLVYSKPPDGSCWGVSCNFKNRKAQSSHNTGSGGRTVWDHLGVCPDWAASLLWQKRLETVLLVQKGYPDQRDRHLGWDSDNFYINILYF